MEEFTFCSHRTSGVTTLVGVTDAGTGEEEEKEKKKKWHSTLAFHHQVNVVGKGVARGDGRVCRREVEGRKVARGTG